jgi:hypothetical protein
MNERIIFLEWGVKKKRNICVFFLSEFSSIQIKSFHKNTLKSLLLLISNLLFFIYVFFCAEQGEKNGKKKSPLMGA